MKKYCAAALVIAVLLLGGCGQAAFETNSDNILPGREVTAYAETSDGTAGDGEDEHTREQTEGQAQVSAPGKLVIRTWPVRAFLLRYSRVSNSCGEG